MTDHHLPKPLRVRGGGPHTNIRLGGCAVSGGQERAMTLKEDRDVISERQMAWKHISINGDGVEQGGGTVN